MAISTLDALNQLCAAVKGSMAETPEEGFHTAEYYAAMKSVHRVHMERILKAGVEMGTVEARKYRVMRTQAVRPIMHYRLLPVSRKAKGRAK